MRLEWTVLSNTYVSCCCESFSQEEFRRILAKDVKLFHRTNDDEPIEASGIEDVVALFNKYVFSNSTHVTLKDRNFSLVSGKPTLTLIVEEDKKADSGTTSRFRFEEITVFEFGTSEDQDTVITSITMTVKKNLLNRLLS